MEIIGLLILLACSLAVMVAASFLRSNPKKWVRWTLWMGAGATVFGVIAIYGESPYLAILAVISASVIGFFEAEMKSCYSFLGRWFCRRPLIHTGFLAITIGLVCLHPESLFGDRMVVIGIILLLVRLVVTPVWYLRGAKTWT